MKKFIVLNNVVFDINDISYAIKYNDSILLGHRPPNQTTKEINVSYSHAEDCVGEPRKISRDFSFLKNELFILNTEVK